MMYTYNGILLSHKEVRFLIPGTMDVVNTMLNKADTERQIFYDSTCISTQNSQFYRDRARIGGHQLQK